jgi:hypothetical protein
MRRISIRIFGVPASLADKRGLRDPVVLVNVTADAALLRGMKGGNFD